MQSHDLDPTKRFSDRVDDYVRSRPSYPPEAIDAILRGFSSPVVAADIGAGTGIAAHLLAARDVKVVAIEPNGAMRCAAVPHHSIEWHPGTAEATGLPNRAVDLVLCAQSFHWFRVNEALLEFARILRPGGTVCLMWNERDSIDPLTEAYWQALLAIGAVHPMDKNAFNPQVIQTNGSFHDLRCEEFANSQRLDGDGFVSRAMSASYVPKTQSVRSELARRLADIFKQHVDTDRQVTMRYITRLYTAIRR